MVSGVSQETGVIPRCAHTGNLIFSFLRADLDVRPSEGDPPGRPYKSLYYFYERNLVLGAGKTLQGKKPLMISG
jgi:hypothetical protein